MVITRSMVTDPYAALGVSKTASQDEIKTAYRKLAKKLHPDLNPGNKEAEKKFKDVNQAYEIIGDPEQRKKFDRGEFDQPQGFGQHDRPFYRNTQGGGGTRYYSNFQNEHGFDDDFLRNIFENFGRGQERPDSFESLDENYKMEIDFKTSVLGGEKEVTFPNGKKLLVKIPPGVEAGIKLRIAGKGRVGSGKTPPGDAFIELSVIPSDVFLRRGHDLEIQLPITLDEAILGGEVKVPTIDGQIMMKVPPGTNSGQKLRVNGKGVPYPNSSKRGDQFVIVNIVLPEKIDDELKSAMQAWSKSHKYNPRSV